VIVVPGLSTAPSALLLAQIFTEAGLPAGVLNVLTGSTLSVGAAVACNASVSSVSYSGNKQVCVCVCVRACVLESVAGRRTSGGPCLAGWHRNPAPDNCAARMDGWMNDVRGKKSCKGF